MGILKFSEAVRERLAQVRGPAVPDQVRRYLEDPARVDEAALVNELAARFASAEGAGEPIGRVAVGRIVPPMGELLRKQLSRDGAGSTSELHTAVLRTIAIGYALFMSAEPNRRAEIRIDRSAAALWKFWVPRIYNGFLDRGLPKNDIQELHEAGVAVLMESLEPLGLGRKARGRRMSMIGMGYAEAGALLRAAQSSQTPPG